MSSLVSSISTSLWNIVGSARLGERKREPSNVEVGKHRTIALRRDFHGKDIDEFRAKWGKEEGEAAFFHDNFEDERIIAKDNLFMFNGACLLFQYALGLGTTSANSSLASGPTLLNNANTYLYVSDGGPTAITGTCSISNGSGSLTTSSSSSGLSIGVNIVITGDTSSQVYTVTAGSGTAWTISPLFGGTTVSTVAAGYFPAPSHSNTTIGGSTNVANQVADSTFPSNPLAAQFNVITGATNATPIVLTVSGADVNANDIVSVVEVSGNTGAVGTFVANPASASSITLLGSIGNGSYTSGGLVTKRNMFTTQSTFGSTSGVFQWNQWAMYNGNGSNKVLANLRSTGLGSKASGTSSALKIGIAIS